MKSAIIFICGGITTFLAFVIFQPLPKNLFRFRSETHHQIAEPIPESTPPSGSSILYKYGEPLIIEDRGGNKFTLRIQGAAGTPLKYFWHSTSGLATSGEGLLFEHDGQINKQEFMKNLGNRQTVRIGNLDLGWSANDSNYGLLYYNPSEASFPTDPIPMDE